MVGEKMNRKLLITGLVFSLGLLLFGVSIPVMAAIVDMSELTVNVLAIINEFMIYIVLLAFVSVVIFMIPQARDFLGGFVSRR